jgi:hypothetical protein
MKCSNCNHQNNPGDLFCSSCGNKLSQENNMNINYSNNTQTIETNEQNNPNYNNTNYNNTNYNNTVQTKPKKNKWVIAGIIIAVVLGLFVIGSNGNENGDGSYNSSFQREDDKTKFTNYLTSMGFTKITSNKYSLYSKGYTYVIDFSQELFSQQGDNSYNVYYYRKDIFGTTLSSDSFKIIATYTFNTYDYNCKTDPSTYQSYACSYMKSTITELAITMKNTFYKFINGAGVSIYNL